MYAGRPVTRSGPGGGLGAIRGGGRGYDKRAGPAITPGATSSLLLAQQHQANQKQDDGSLNLEEYINNRDWTGALAILEFNKNNNKHDPKYPTLLWIGYCAFHLGAYEKAMNAYKELLAQAESDKENKADSTKKGTDNNNSSNKKSTGSSVDPMVHVYLACCYYFLGLYKEAEEEALKGPSAPLQNRLLFHIAQKFGDEQKLLVYHGNIQETIEDQLSLASMHFLRNHHQEATDIYKRILLEQGNFAALNVYVALCYYKLDYYDVSLEVLNTYLAQHPDSATAINLRACNHYRLFNGNKSAEEELKTLIDLQNASYSYNKGHSYQHYLVQHNLVVFRNGEDALQKLVPLIDIIPEARLNLVIYHLRNDEVQDAFALIKDLEPVTPQEYILQGVVYAAVGQMMDSREHLRKAQQCFQLVGASASECDTIPGRQCMASCFFLLKQFDDVLIYLKSIKGYFYHDDDFHWNYGIAQAASGLYKEAEETLLQIQNEKYRNDYCYISWLARCYIQNRKARLAWELYIKMETTQESFSLLQLIANECYKVGAFFYSAKAFDVLERIDPHLEYVDGKKGACVGVFQQVIAGKEQPENLRHVLDMLRNNGHKNNQEDYIARVIKNWAKEKHLQL